MDDQLKRMLKQVEAEKEYHLSLDMMPCIKTMLKDKFYGSDRNQVAFIIATELRATGKDKDKVNSILQLWNEQNVPPLKQTNIRSAVKSAFKKNYKFFCYTDNEYINDYCIYPDKRECRFYQIHKKTTKTNDLDYFKYGWAGKVSNAATVLYWGLIYTEKTRGFAKGSTMYISVRTFKKYFRFDHRTLKRASNELAKHNLITYKTGKQHSINGEASEYKRIIPIPVL